jgi:hypothetical protein
VGAYSWLSDSHLVITGKEEEEESWEGRRTAKRERERDLPLLKRPKSIRMRAPSL